MTEGGRPADGTSDVAVIGAGPVGCVLALQLADRGHAVTLIERHRAPYPLPRAVHFDDETARILQGVGLGSRLAELSEPVTIYEWQNGDGVPLLRLGTRQLGVSGWPASNMFNQPDLEALLHERVEAHPGIDLRRGRTAQALVDDETAAEVTVHLTSADDTAETVRARYVVGCDGANSFVRGVLDPPMEDHGFFYDWLIVDVALHDARVFEPANLQICDPHRPTTVISGGPGRRRWEFMCLPGEDLSTLDDEAGAWELLAPWDVTPDNATMVRHAGYRFQARWATRWSTGRVFLAGDAAHQTPPFAGQGMCSGLRDAANLSWKLDLVLTGRAPADLLTTYEQERLPHAAAVIGFAVELGKIICVPDADEAAARDAAMAPSVVGDAITEVAGMPPLTDGLLAADTSGAGELFLQALVDAGSGPQRFDDAFGVGWRVVTDTAAVVAALPAETARWFTGHLDGRFVTVGADGDATDVEGRYAHWFAGHDACAAVQRPDFTTYGTAATPAELAALIDSLRERLTA